MIHQDLVLETNVASMRHLGLTIGGTIGTHEITVAGPGWDSDTGILTLGRVPRHEGLRQRLTLIVRGPLAKQVEFKPEHVEPSDLKVTVASRGHIGQENAVSTPLIIDIPPGMRPGQPRRLGPGQTRGDHFDHHASQGAEAADWSASSSKDETERFSIKEEPMPLMCLLRSVAAGLLALLLVTGGLFEDREEARSGPTRSCRATGFPAAGIDAAHFFGGTAQDAVSKLTFAACRRRAGGEGGRFRKRFEAAGRRAASCCTAAAAR